MVDGVLLPSMQSAASQDDFERFGSSALTFPVSHVRTSRRSCRRLSLPSLSRSTLFHCYAQQLWEARLSECRQQVEAIRRGMSELLPDLALFPLLSPV